MRRVADREGREGLVGWWVLSYNWPFNTLLTTSTQNSSEYYHIIGPSIRASAPGEAPAGKEEKL